jgi:hypothetical protein
MTPVARSYKLGLKAVLLHIGNKHPSVPMARYDNTINVLETAVGT